MHWKDPTFCYTQECQQAFESINPLLVRPSVLRRADPALPYILQTDWNPIAAILTQQDASGEEHPMAYVSTLLQALERKYSATEGEGLLWSALWSI